MTTDLPGAADPRGPQMNWLTPFVVVRDPKAGQWYYGTLEVRRQRLRE